jgi:hypothetical protein
MSGITLVYCADPGCDELVAASPGLGLIAFNVQHTTKDANGNDVTHKGELHLLLDKEEWQIGKYSDAQAYVDDLKKQYPKATYQSQMI